MKFKLFSLAVIASIMINCLGGISFAKINSQTDLSTSIAFITDDSNETEFVTEIDKKIKNEDFLSKHKLKKEFFNNVNTKKIEKKATSNSRQFKSKDNSSINAETICINYDIFKSQSGIVDRVKELVDNGTTVLFFGENIDMKKFCESFGLEKNIPKEMSDKQSEVQECKDITVCIGIEKSEWGYSLLQNFSTEYNFYRVVDGLYASAEHAKKIKIKKPYKDVDGNRTSMNSKNPIEAFTNMFTNTANASGIDDYPIINSVRYQSDFGTYDCNWHLITDCYMHRVPDEDSQRDYFVFETISEFDSYYDENDIFINNADQFYSKLSPAYTNDIVRAGAPEDQGGTTSVSVAMYPPQIAFTYQPGSKISVDSTLSLQNKYFEAYYDDASFWGTGFDGPTIFRTELSFSCYAPNSNYTYVGVNIYQKARNLSHHDQYPWAFNGTLYYYNY